MWTDTAPTASHGSTGAADDQLAAGARDRRTHRERRAQLRSRDSDPMPVRRLLGTRPPPPLRAKHQRAPAQLVPPVPVRGGCSSGCAPTSMLESGQRDAPVVPQRNLDRPASQGVAPTRRRVRPCESQPQPVHVDRRGSQARGCLGACPVTAGRLHSPPRPYPPLAAVPAPTPAHPSVRRPAIRSPSPPERKAERAPDDFHAESVAIGQPTARAAQARHPS